MQRVDGDECYSKVKEAVAFQHITGWAHEGDLSVRTTFIWVFAGFQYGNDEGFFPIVGIFSFRYWQIEDFGQVASAKGY